MPDDTAAAAMRPRGVDLKANHRDVLREPCPYS